MHRKMGRQRYNKDKCKIRETDRWINKPDRERGIWHGQTKTDRQTGRQMDRHVDRHRDRQTVRQPYG